MIHEASSRLVCSFSPEGLEFIHPAFAKLCQEEGKLSAVKVSPRALQESR
jgi:hypothetical protein